MVAAGGDIEQGEEVGRLTGGGQHGRGATFEGADLRRDEVVRRVLQAGVEVAGSLKVEQLAHVLGRIVLERGGLDDRDHTGLTVFRLVAGLDAFGFLFHVASTPNVGPYIAHGNYSSYYRIGS